MGVDILMYLERRTSEGWSFPGQMEQNDIHCTEDEEIVPAVRPVPLFEGRNSALFAMLGYYRRPIWSTRRYKIVAPLRGLPSDLSPELLEWSSYWYDEGEIRGSWLRPNELLRFNWSQTMLKLANVDPRVVHLFGNGKQPFPYKQWPSDIPVGYGTYYKDSRNGSGVTWIETYADSARPEFMEKVIGVLRDEPDPDNVRVVFWFDY